MLIEIPNYFFGTLRYFEQDLKIDVAILLYHRKALTLARAARWLGGHVSFGVSKSACRARIYHQLYDGGF